MRRLAAASESASDAHPPDLLVFGLGRSGTSLLMAMLDAHEDVFLVADSGRLRRLAGRASRRLFPSFLSRSRRDAENRVGGFDVFARELRTHAPPGVKVVGEKTPAHLEFACAAAAYWPGTKFIEIRRDPRSVLASRKLAAWSEGRALVSHLLAMRTHQRLGRLAELHSPERYRVVQYERLVREPRQALEPVLAFLGLHWSPSVLGHEEEARRLVTGPEREWKERILQPVDETRIEAWKETLTSFEAMAATLTLGDVRFPSAPLGAAMFANMVRLMAPLVVVALLLRAVLLAIPVLPAGDEAIPDPFDG